MSVEGGIRSVQSIWEEIHKEVEAAWADVFKVVNAVIDSHLKFGFEKIESNINPSFHDILLSLKMMEALLAVFPVDDVEYSTSRMILNAKQQINNIEQVVTALKHDRQDDYEEAMRKLRSQPQF